MKHYEEVKLNVDTDRLGKEYLDFKHHLGFKTDDKRNIDFNAICINRIPGDPNSITGAKSVAQATDGTTIFSILKSCC